MGFRPRPVDQGAIAPIPPANPQQGLAAEDPNRDVPVAANGSNSNNGQPASNDPQPRPGNAEEGKRQNMNGGKKKRKGRKSRKTKGKKRTMKRKRSKGKTRRRH